MKHSGIRAAYKLAHGFARSALKRGDVQDFVNMTSVLRNLTNNWDTGLELRPFSYGGFVKFKNRNEIACYRLAGPYLSGRKLLRSM